MPGEPLVEPLALDIQPALDALEPLGAALTELASEFGRGLTDALGAIGEVKVEPIPADQIVDAPAISEAIVGAVGDVVAPPVAVEADTTGLDVGIADALDQPRPP